MRRYLLLSFFLCISFLNISFGQIEATLLGNWQDQSLPATFAFDNPYNEVWGFVHNGAEYAVIGSTLGTHFIALDGPNAFTEIAYVAGRAQGTGLIHRDFHTYQNYLYAVADEGPSSLQIIDFTNLPNSVEVVYDSQDLIVTSHNIFIDEPNALLYSTTGGILSLSNPEVPVKVGDIPGFHDLFVKDNIFYGNNGFNGLLVGDCANAANCNFIGDLSNYVNNGYNHSGWLSEDGTHYFMCDETGGADVKSVNIENLDAIEVVDRFNSGNLNPSHVAHNAMVRGDLLFVSYYTDGLQVFDVSDPTSVYKKYYYDTYPGTFDAGFQGAWGIYALLPSGRILISDMQTGLYVVEIPDTPGTFVENPYVTADCENGITTFEMTIDNAFGTEDVTLSTGTVPAGVKVSFSENPAPAGATVVISLTNPGAFNFDLDIIAMNSTANFTNTVSVFDAPGIIPLLPKDGTRRIVNSPGGSFFISWASLSDDITEVDLEISTDPGFLDIVLTREGIASTVTNIASNQLEIGNRYYWRLNYDGACGPVSSSTFSFFYDVRKDLSFDGGLDICTGDETGAYTLTLGETFANDMTQLNYAVSSSDLVLDFGMTDLTTLSGADQLQLQIDPSTPPGIYTVTFELNDGQFSSTTEEVIEVRSAPDYPDLLFPADGILNSDFAPTFEWTALADNGISSYTLIIALDENFNEIAFATDIDPTLNTYTLPEELMDGIKYYWTIQVNDACAPANDQPVFNFTTIDVNSTTNLTKQLVDVYPNPTRNQVTLEFKNNQAGTAVVSLINASGQYLNSWNIQNLQNKEILHLRDLPAGVYWFRIQCTGTEQIERLVVLPQ